MGITIRIPDQLKRKLSAAALIDKADLSGALEVSAGALVKRTQSQQGIDGPLPALSKGYAKFKSASGRNPVPDRTFSGKLLKAIHSKISAFSAARAEGRLYFMATEQKKARAMQQLAKFFGLNREERAALISNLRTIVNKRMSK